MLARQLAAPLAAGSHVGRFGTLLLLEEIQAEADIRLYDLKAAVMEPTPSGQLLKLRVRGRPLCFWFLVLDS